MFDRDKLRFVIEDWHRNHIGSTDILFREMEAFIEAVLREQKITDGQAIAQLNQSGWMREHDALMSFDSLTSIINGIMREGDKSISVNIYPWKGDDDETS